MIKILELFGGIGACSKALERIGIEYDIADYVDNDKYAVINEEDYKLLIEYINYLCKKINKLNKYINSNPLVFIGDTDIYVDDIKSLENGGWKNLKFFKTISKILGDKE